MTIEKKNNALSAFVNILFVANFINSILSIQIQMSLWSWK